MAKLSSIVIRRTAIPYLDQSFDVRGISAGDLVSIVQVCGPVMALAFGKVQSMYKAGDRLTTDKLKEIISGAVGEFKQVAGSIIAAASDSFTEESIETASTLPLAVQVQALEEVFHLTFVSEAEVKKMVESLLRMAAAATEALTEPSTSLTGTGA